MDQTAPMELAHFKPHLETLFTLPTPDGEEDLKLALLDASEIKDQRPESDRSGRAPFVLVFACKTFLISQGVYRLEHDVLDPVEVFLSPFEAYHEGSKLEAVFN
jgi:hypothetical protein